MFDKWAELGLDRGTRTSEAKLISKTVEALLRAMDEEDLYERRFEAIMYSEVIKGRHAYHKSRSRLEGLLNDPTSHSAWDLLTVKLAERVKTITVYNALKRLTFTGRISENPNMMAEVFQMIHNDWQSHMDEQEFILNHSKRAEFEMCWACSEYLDTNFDSDDEGDDTLRSVRQVSSSRVSLEEAMGLVRDGSYCLLVWNVCYGGDPCLSEEGVVLYKRLKEEEFDYNSQVILMEVLRRLGREKATGRYSAFALGLIEKRYVHYVDRSEYDGYEGVDIDDHGYVRDKLMEHLDKYGVITKEEYGVLLEESYTIQITYVLLG
ncbi:hypothetical protein ACEPAF_11 [Sanghuangporus sanghuang]